MREVVTGFVPKFLVYKRTKMEHQKPSVLLQPLDVAQWKWDYISMDFVDGLQ